jgi:general nucleoside transport system ATP-binding protein
MQIQLKNIQKFYGSVHANDDITLTIEPGQILGVLGENGAGKSTLMKILSGLISKDSGEIFIGREKQALSSPSDALRLGIGMLHQDPHDFPSMAIKEDLRIWDPSTRVKKTANDWQELVEIQNDLGFHINLNGTVGELTVGERQQLELTRLLWLGVEVLILDEPTTGISAAQQEVLFSALKKLAQQGKTVIFVSHKLEEVKELCSRAVVLRKGCLIGERPAPFDENDLVKLMFGRQITRARTGEAGTQDVRLSIRNLNIEDFRINIENANLDLYAGEVIGLAGMEGSGQRQFLQTLAGLRQSTGGRIEFDGENINGRNCFEFQKRGIFYVPSARMEEGLVPGMTLEEHYILSDCEKSMFINMRESRKSTEKRIERFNIKGRASTNSEELSGGNQQRLLLSLLREPAGLLLLENPTRGLDIESTNWIWSILRERCQAGTTIIFSSADLDELTFYADRILVFFSGRVSEPLASTGLDEEKLGRMIGGKDWPK